MLGNGPAHQLGLKATRSRLFASANKGPLSVRPTLRAGGATRPAPSVDAHERLRDAWARGVRSAMSLAVEHAPVPEADVCIVGAGPAGAVAARRLAEDAFSVVVLERGQWPDRSTIRVGEPDFELWPGREWLWRPDDRQGCWGSADRRARLRRLGADVERRRRLDGPLRRTVASQHAVRFQAAVDRGHRGRLAAHVRGFGAVLPAGRAGIRHLRAQRRSRVPRNGLPDAAGASARVGRPPCARAQHAGVALVARIKRDRHAAVRTAPGVHRPGVVHVRLSGAGEVLAGSHPLARRRRARCAARDASTRGRHRDRRPWARDRRRLCRPGWRRAPTAREGRDRGGQLRGHSVAAVVLGVSDAPGRPGQLERPRRPASDGAPVRRCHRNLRGFAAELAEPGRSADVLRAVLRDG